MSMAQSSAPGGTRRSFGQSSPQVEASSHGPKKRPRPVLSCIECRKKKLKCDRLLPCTQCTRGNRISQCLYQSWDDSQTQPRVASEESESEIGSIRKKVRGVEPNIPLAPRDSASDQFSAPLNGQNEKSGLLEDLQSRVEKLERLLSAYSQSHARAPSQESSEPPQVCSEFWYIVFRLHCNFSGR
jgi:hypothetical protein